VRLKRNLLLDTSSRSDDSGRVKGRSPIQMYDCLHMDLQAVS
jgi:hypothetical protein